MSVSCHANVLLRLHTLQREACCTSYARAHLVNDLRNDGIVQRNVRVVVQQRHQQPLQLARLDVARLVQIINPKCDCVLTSCPLSLHVSTKDGGCSAVAMR